MDRARSSDAWTALQILQGERQKGRKPMASWRRQLRSRRCQMTRRMTTRMSSTLWASRLCCAYFACLMLCVH